MNELCMFLQHNYTVGYATHQRSSMELTTDQRTLRSAGSIGEECIWEVGRSWWDIKQSYVWY